MSRITTILVSNHPWSDKPSVKLCITEEDGDEHSITLPTHSAEAILGLARTELTEHAKNKPLLTPLVPALAAPAES
jgi:hypothetical protein